MASNTTTSEQAQATAADAAATARTAAERTQHGLGRLVRDSAYATIGVGDLAVSVVRNFGEKAAQVRTDAPKALRTGVDPRQVRAQLSSRLEEVRSGATEEFLRLSERGRSLVEHAQHNQATRRATEQVDNARSQVKAATTSVGRAARFVGEAAGDTATSVGDDSPVDYDAMTLDELREMARVRQISGRSTMNRSELVKALRAE